ncbi:MAG: class I SAM-dependent methyltransferase [Elusimicrobiales bacterium]|jgi:ubiquinone/menaquinone biosynthesis C-methylase UbiE
MEKECPVCGKSAARAYRPGISRCGGCGLAWLDEKRFGEPEYAAGALEDIYVSAKRELFARALKTLEKPAPGKGELLDLGSAYGDLLAAAEKEGWQAEGVEISPGPASAALKKGFMVYTRPVEELGLPENFYDVATAFEVFSQMSDPPKAAAELYRILNPG